MRRSGVYVWRSRIIAEDLGLFSTRILLCSIRSFFIFIFRIFLPSNVSELIHLIIC